MQLPISHCHRHCLAVRRLTVTAHSLAAPLPAIQPGALPALLELTLNVPQFRTRLPASWGDSAILPSLTFLSLALDVDGPLPPEWALGFERLLQLEIINGGSQAMKGYMAKQAAEMASLRPHLPPSPPLPGPAEVQGTLPREWARGFPALQHFSLFNLRLTGSLPDEWLNPTALPSLQKL